MIRYVGHALEFQPNHRIAQMCEWLEDTFGPSSVETWFIDEDYDLVTLNLTPEINSVYLLRWA